MANKKNDVIEIDGNITTENRNDIEEIVNKLVDVIGKVDGLKAIVIRKGDIGKPYVFMKLRKFDKRDIMVGLNSNSFTNDPEKHILMADFDLSEKVTLSNAKLELASLQEAKALPKIKLYKSSDMGVFGLCFTPMSFDEMIESVGMLKSQDESHKFCILKNGFATLRLTPKHDKPSNIKLIEEILPKRESHRQYLHGAEKIFEEMIGCGE